jgi:hypothetical protein
LNPVFSTFPFDIQLEFSSIKIKVKNECESVGFAVVHVQIVPVMT